MDDEYFRAMLTSRHDVAGPDADAARENFLRSLERTQAQGLLNSMLSGMSEIELTTPAGLYLGKAGSYDVDHGRLSRVVRRVTLGLLYHARQSRLPDEYEARTYYAGALRDKGRESALAIAQALRDSGSPKFVGKNVLTYWWKQTPEDPHATAWLLIFYGKVPFIAITVKSADARHDG